MHQLGVTRSALARNYALLTPDTFVRAPLPGMKRATAIVHTSPAMTAAFMQYTAEFEPDGELGATPSQRFVYVLEGELAVVIAGHDQVLRAGGYAYLPEGGGRVRACTGSRAAVIEKSYQPLAMVPHPVPLAATEDAVPPEALNGDEWLIVRKLLPDDPAFDFAVNTMLYLPGAALSMVEAHVMEHGLLMLEGGGIYRLDDHWYPVSAGDFIWMGPYCPQWFGALGKTPAKYLIYKDWNRHPLTAK
jgi:(S)-ureidoglycine aminohydrolase